MNYFSKAQFQIIVLEQAKVLFLRNKFRFLINSKRFLRKFIVDYKSNSLDMVMYCVLLQFYSVK